MNVKNLAELRGTWLLTTSTPLNLTGVKVLQNTEKRGVVSRGEVKDKGSGVRGVANVRWRQVGHFLRENYKNHKIFNDRQMRSF